jgi:hypothetical protein
MIRAAVKISHRSVRKLHQGMGAPLGWGYHNAHKWIFACTDGGYLLLECADESEDNTGRGWSGAGSVTSLSDEDGSRLWKAAEEPKID